MRRRLRETAEEAAVEVANLAAQSPGSTIYVKGPAGSGRSLVLEQAEAVLRGRDYSVVTVAPPARHYDTAAIALLDAAVGLERIGHADGLHRRWKRLAPWAARVEDVREALSQASTDQAFVLVVDDPDRWAVPESAEFQQRFQEVSDLLVRDISGTRLVATGASIESPNVVSLLPLTATDVFGNSDDWGILAGAAAALGEALPELAARTPAEIGFVVALTALTSIDRVRSWWDLSLTVDVVGDRLAEHIRTEPALKQLWVAWASASVPRRTMNPGVHVQLSAPSRPELAAIFERCLLTIGGDRLAREARAAAWRSSADALSVRVRRTATLQLIEQLDADYEAAVRSDDARQLLIGAELTHHAGLVGDSFRVQALPAPLSDQLDAVGMDAIERSDRSMAAKAFELALEIDEDDAVARHYLAYTLDSDAREPRRAEQAYERALALDNRHATWHSRLICFLVVQARMADAHRRWSWSRAQLLKGDGGGPLDLFARLHLPVAAQLLRRAETQMTNTVLGDVPEWARKQLPGYSAQLHRLELLEASQDTGVFVPAYRATPVWWKEPPELLSDTHPDGRPLQRWMAGTIEAITEVGWTLYVAVVGGSSRPSAGTATLSWEQVNEFCTDRSRLSSASVGDFVELGFYGQGTELHSDPILRILRYRPWGEGIETALESDRYIRRAFV